MPPQLRQGLSSLSRAEGATHSVTLLAIFCTLLYRYTGQTDILVGTTIAGYRRSETDGPIVSISNMLPLRADLSGDLTFRKLLCLVRDATVGLHAHQRVPFESLVEELQLKCDRSRSALVQVMFDLRVAGGTDPQFKAFAPAPSETEAGPTGFDLSLNVHEEPQALHAAWDYSTDLWDKPTIARMAEHFWTLLAAAVAGPDRRLSELPLLTEAERRQMLVEWNRTSADFPADKCVHELFEEQAALNPDAVAVIHRDEQLTRGRLNERANQLAHYLRSLGIGRQTPVAICIRRSLDMVVGVLGILKAGGAYVPLDPVFPRERVAYMLRDAGAQTLITQEEFLPQFRDYPGRVIALDSASSILAAQPGSNLERANLPEDLIYIIYTSGTTGRPKGILISHRGVVNFLQFLRNTYNLGEKDTILLLPSIAWDGSVDDLFLPLTMGGKLVIPTDAEVTDPEALLRHVGKRQVTALLSVVPTLLRALTAAKHEVERSTAALRLLIVAGEAWFLADYRKAQAVFGDGVLIANHYGPTECTCTQVFYPVRTPPAGEDGVMCLGRPTPNHEVYILDAHRQPVPIGVPGEICIGGVGLARGYVNLPELTAEKFVPHPFSGQPGARLYRTGDLGRYRSDGNVEFLGRMDQQVKLRGFRIELGEIMTVLGRHPGVQQSVIVRWEQRPGDAHLVAYVIPSRRLPPTTGELRGFLQRELPEYMVPSIFVFMETFPLGPTGKVDARALPAPDRSRAERPYAAPRTPIEEMMAAIWAKVLRVSPIGIEDNFFELGGHSLLATQVISRLHEELGVEISFQQFFKTPSVACLSLVVAHRLAELATPQDQDVDRMLGQPGRRQ
jgi:amino acid adenylation domain-containing protein